MVELEATARQNYDGKSYRAGETMKVNNEADAADLVALRMAVRKAVAVAVAPVNRAVETETETVATVQDGESATAEQESKDAKYKRRDMRPAR